MKSVLTWALLLALAVSPLTFDRQNVTYSEDSLDANGRTVGILAQGAKENGATLSPEEENGNIVSDACYMRNQKVSQLHNVALKYYEIDDAARMALMATLAADDYFELTLLPANQLVSPLLAGCFLNLASCEKINLSQPWWHTDANVSMMVGEKLYAALNDLTPDVLANAYVMTFENEEIRDEVYQLVDAGRWTLDRMKRLLREQGGSLDGDASVLLQGMDSAPRLNDGEEGLSLRNATSSLQRTANRLTSAYQIHSSDASLFRVTTLGETDGAYIVPLPKLNDWQESYLTPQSSETPLLSISILSSDVTESTIIADALQYYSWYFVSEAYLARTALHVGGARYSSGEDANRMLRYVEYARTMDVNEILGVTSSFSKALSEQLPSGERSVEALFSAHSAKIEKSWNQALASLSALPW